MNELPTDMSIQIYSLLSDATLKKLTCTCLWSHLASILSSPHRAYIFWKLRVARLVDDRSAWSVTLPLSQDIDWKLIYRFVIASRRETNVLLLHSLSRHHFNLKLYSDTGGLISAIDDSNFEATRILLQEGDPDRIVLKDMASRLLSVRGHTDLTALLVNHVRDPYLDHALESTIWSRRVSIIVSVVTIGVLLMLFILPMLLHREGR